MSNMFNPVEIRDALPMSVGQMLILLALFIILRKYGGRNCTWRNAAKAIVTNVTLMIAWAIIFVVTILLSNIMVPVITTIANLLALVVLPCWYSYENEAHNNYLCVQVEKFLCGNEKWLEVFAFWSEFFFRELRFMAMMLILATASNIISMAIHAAIWIMVSYLLNLFLHLAEINWNNQTVDKAATIIIGSIAIAKLMNRIRLTGLLAIVIMVVVVVIAMYKSGTHYVGIIVGVCEDDDEYPDVANTGDIVEEADYQK